MSENNWAARISGAFHRAAERAGGVVSGADDDTVSPSAGGVSINVATGQNTAGVIQTAGDLPDANWTVTNADNYQDAPIAYTVAPGDADWYSQWPANGPSSSWIAADPNNKANGDMTFTLTFSLNGYDPADAELSAGEFAIDDAGSVYLNGHELGTQAFNGWENGLTALSNGAGDFVAGVNTLVIQGVDSDNQWEAARLQGTIVDTVPTTPPGPIHWANAVNGNFATAADWTGGFAPVSSNDAILDPTGAAYTVTASASASVNSIQTAANATLDITGGVFTATTGTGSGANAGTIEVGNGEQLTVGGTLDNTGLVTLDQTASAVTSIDLVSGVTLSGGGAVTLSDSPNNAISATGGAQTLTNVDNTISGSGVIGGGASALTIANEAAGVIDASGTANALILDAGGGDSNAGLIEATGAGGLTISGGTLDQSAGGTISAAGARVLLRDIDVVGGTLAVSGSGAVWAVSTGDVFDGTAGHAVTIAGEFQLANTGTVTLEGSIVNTATALIGVNGTASDLLMGAGGVTLSGGGRWVLGNGAANVIDAAAAATLTNVDNRIVGAGVLGDADMTLINEAGGVINGDDAVSLTIDTGANTIVNAGEIAGGAAGGTTVESAVDNTGLLFAAKGNLTVEGAVSGAGRAIVNGATLSFQSSFSQDVAFTTAGTLELAQSQNYAGTVSGFSKTGGTSLDLSDIAFVSAGEATYAAGVLTVTDGTHTALIHLSGNYAGSTFVASSDGNGGTIVTDPGAGAAAAPANAPVHRFVAAASSLGTTNAGMLAMSPDTWRNAPAALATPRA